MMMRLILLGLAWLLVPAAGWAAAGKAEGHSGLALAALVAARSPSESARDRRVMAALFDGKLKVPYPAGRKIAIAADSISCRAGDVDIAMHACEISFDHKTVTLNGREAHELYATMVEVGVPSEGAAGTLYESLSHLNCTVDPGEIRQRDGGGAACRFDFGAP